MAEYIERSQLELAFCNADRDIINPSAEPGNEEAFTISRVLDIIAEQHTVDAAPKWVSVKDRLPEDDGPVIAVYHFKGNTVRYISTLSYFCFDPQPHWQHESTGLVVTHWMPLPEPPKEDSDG